MRFALEINMDDDAFIDNGAGEVARILREVAAQVPAMPVGVQTAFTLRDVNGNRVGVARYLATGESLC